MSEIIHFNQHTILPPDAFGSMDSVLIGQYAQQAAEFMEQSGGEHAFHPSVISLQAFMQHGLAACSFEDGKVSSLIELAPQVIYHNGKPVSQNKHGDEGVLMHVDHGLACIVGLKSGNLVVHPSNQNKDLEMIMKKTLAGHALQTFPNIPLLSVVANDDDPSLHVYEELGWLPITSSQSMKLLKGVDVLDGWKPQSTIFIHPDSLNWGQWHVIGMKIPTGSQASQVIYGGPLCR